MGVTLAYARGEEERPAWGRMVAGCLGLGVVAAQVLAMTLFLVMSQWGMLTDWGDVWTPVRWVTGGVYCAGCG